MTPNKIGKYTLTRGRSRTRPRYVIYGAGSVGKTTLAASAPNPLFVQIEDGAREFDVVRPKFDDATGREVPRSYEEVIDLLSALATSDLGDRETLVLDGLHQLDVLVQDYVCRQNPKWKSIQTAGFGVGESEVLDKWRAVTTRLEDINTRKNMRVVLTGHAQVAKFKNPEGAEFDRYDLAVTKHPKGDVAAFLYGWAEVFAFAKFETLTHEVGKRTVGLNIASDRIMHLTWTNAFQAKCRLGGPETIQLSRDGTPRSWAEIFGEIEDKAPERLRARIVSMLEYVDDDTRAKCQTWLAKVGDDVSALAQGLENMKKKAEERKMAA
jgi:hypothetical protein